MPIRMLRRQLTAMRRVKQVSIILLGLAATFYMVINWATACLNLPIIWAIVLMAVPVIICLIAGWCLVVAIACSQSLECDLAKIRAENKAEQQKHRTAQQIDIPL